MSAYIRLQGTAWWHRVSDVERSQVAVHAKACFDIPTNPDGYPVAIYAPSVVVMPDVMTVCGRRFTGNGYAVNVGGRPGRGRFCRRCAP